jgi:hypothetical protein
MHPGRPRRSASHVTPWAGMPRNTSKKNWEVIMRLNSWAGDHGVLGSVMQMQMQMQLLPK